MNQMILVLNSKCIGAELTQITAESIRIGSVVIVFVLNHIVHIRMGIVSSERVRFTSQ